MVLMIVVNTVAVITPLKAMSVLVILDMKMIIMVAA